MAIDAHAESDKMVNSLGVDITQINIWLKSKYGNVLSVLNV